jgi:signal transduction histidine kinase
MFDSRFQSNRPRARANKYNVHDIQDVKERQRAVPNEPITSQQTEARATLEEVAAGLAHDILNPVAGLAGAIDVLRYEFPDDHPRQELLRQMRGELERIQGVLMGLAEYARPKPLQAVVADLNATVAKAVEMTRMRFHDRGVEIALMRSADLPPLAHDPMKLSQALAAITASAVRASSGGDRMEIRLTRNANAAAIQIQDAGAAPSGAELEKMFQPFGGGKQRGAGIALALAGSIVEQHGGTISARIPDNGVGLIVRIELPLDGAPR